MQVDLGCLCVCLQQFQRFRFQVLDAMDEVDRLCTRGHSPLFHSRNEGRDAYATIDPDLVFLPVLEREPAIGAFHGHGVARLDAFRKHVGVVAETLGDDHDLARGGIPG
jgi:hypothetical protein